MSPKQATYNLLTLHFVFSRQKWLLKICPVLNRRQNSQDIISVHCSKSSFFVQKFNFNFPRKLSNFFGWKTRENVVVLDFLAVDNFDFTRKIVKNIFCEKLVKMLVICQNWIFGQKFDFSNSVQVQDRQLLIYYLIFIFQQCRRIQKFTNKAIKLCVVAVGRQ